MELAEALEVLVGRTRHEAFRNFVDPTHPRYHPAWEAEVIRLALEAPTDDAVARPIATTSPAGECGDSAAPLTLAQSLAFQAEANECPHRSRDEGCGCAGHRCALSKGRGDGLVNDWDCLRCLGYIDGSGAPTRKGAAPISN